MANVDAIFNKWKSRWVSSVLEVFILFAISIKERYGGELVNLSHKHVDQTAKVPTVYAIIKRYTSAGILIEFQMEEKSEITRGKSRIYYKLSKEGDELINKIEQQIQSKRDLQLLNFTGILGVNK